MANNEHPITLAIQHLEMEKEKLLRSIQQLEQFIDALKGFTDGFLFPENDVRFKNLYGDSLISALADRNQRIFIGSKSVAEAAREYLTKTGKPATASAIHQGLINSGYDFPEKWDEKFTLKNLAITLSKNKDYFVVHDGGVYSVRESESTKNKDIVSIQRATNEDISISLHTTA